MTMVVVPADILPLVRASLILSSCRILMFQPRMMGGGAPGPYSGGYGGAAQGYGGMGSGMGAAQGYGGMGGMGGPAQGGYGGYGAPSHDIYGGGYGGAAQQAAYSPPPAQVTQTPPVQDVSPPSAGWNYTVLRLRGMPFNANEQHIVVS